MSELKQYRAATLDYITCRRRPHCDSCKKFEKTIRELGNEVPLSIFDTDSASPVSFSLQDEGKVIFSIGPDGSVTVNPDIEIDDVGRAFWKAVKRTASFADTSTDDDGELARVKVLPAARDGKPSGFNVLFINGVLITGMSPDSIVAQAVNHALKVKS